MNEPDYTIAWTTAARRGLPRLPEKVAIAVVEFLYGSLAASPHRVGKPLKLSLKDFTAHAAEIIAWSTALTTSSTWSQS